MKTSINKKAQVGETMTWVVATIIIVVVLGISILTTNFVLSGGNLDISLKDKEKDFLATKSVTNFLNDSENLEFVKNVDENSDKTKIDKFLRVLPSPPEYSFGGWNVQIGENQIKTFSILVNPLGRYDYFDIIFTNEKLNIKFWMECEGLCR